MASIYLLKHTQIKAYGIPEGSPLRNVESLFWQPRVNDSGVVHSTSFYALSSRGKINLCTPARAVRFGEDGRSILLNNGRTISADVVILATGYRSSWENLFDGNYVYIKLLYPLLISV
jgi:hypothetical protein